MALTVRPDDEVYQFDTVWLGPDEYTLPIQARYVAWGTWLSCFLVAAAVLVPLGGSRPSGVLGSLIWSVAVSVVVSRAVMLVVDHERPLRSLPKLFGAEARAALASTRQGERPTLLRPARIRVREVPEKAHRIRARQRRAEEKRERRKAARRPASTRSSRRDRRAALLESAPAGSALPALQSEYEEPPPVERGGPLWSGASTPYGDWDEPDPDEHWAPARYQQEATPFTDGWVAPQLPAAPDQSATPGPVPAAARQLPAGGPRRSAEPPAPEAQPAGSAQPIEERILLPLRKAR